MMIMYYKGREGRRKEESREEKGLEQGRWKEGGNFFE